MQGSGNSEIWIGPVDDDDDVINEPISKKIWIGPGDDDDVISEPISKKKYKITCHEN